MLVMRQFTHIGTVVYKKSENQDFPFKSQDVPYKYLNDDDINETLDQAWAWQTTKLGARGLEELGPAHAYYEKFEFGAK